MAKVAHGSLGLGMLMALLTAVSKLAAWAPMMLGPRSFAAGSALLLLVAIAIHTCPGVCQAENAPKA